MLLGPRHNSGLSSYSPAYRGRTLRRNKPPSRESCQTSSRLTSYPGAHPIFPTVSFTLYVPAIGHDVARSASRNLPLIWRPARRRLSCHRLLFTLHLLASQSDTARPTLQGVSDTRLSHAQVTQVDPSERNISVALS